MGPFNPGEFVDGTFRIVRYLSQGKAGLVYECALIKDMPYGRTSTRVALKFYKSWVLEEPNQVDRIRREASTGSRLKHPHLVHILDSHVDLSRAWATYLVMEYLDGETLDRWVAHNYPSTPPVGPYEQECVRIARQLAGAVAALHRNGILHRDIKPENIMIVRNHDAKLMDFGVIKPLAEHTITSSYQFLGTIRNAAPEYLFESVESRAMDVYSLGTVFYALLTGEGPFHDDHFARLVEKKRRPAVHACQRIKHSEIAHFLSGLAMAMMAPLEERVSDLLARKFLRMMAHPERWRGSWLTFLDKHPKLNSMDHPLPDYLEVYTYIYAGTVRAEARQRVLRHLLDRAMGQLLDGYRRLFEQDATNRNELLKTKADVEREWIAERMVFQRDEMHVLRRSLEVWYVVKYIQITETKLSAAPWLTEKLDMFWITAVRAASLSEKPFLAAVQMMAEGLNPAIDSTRRPVSDELLSSAGAFKLQAAHRQMAPAVSALEEEFIMYLLRAGWDQSRISSSYPGLPPEAIAIVAAIGMK